MHFNIAILGIICACLLEINADFDDYNDTTQAPRGRCPSLKNKLLNGKVKHRSRGRIAKFVCNSNYELVGRRFATCVRGRWNYPIPICVTRGCSTVSNPSNGERNVLYKGAVITFACDPGYILRGSVSIYCDGINWNDTVPSCDIALLNPTVSCDFEDPNLCGWSHDRNHDFDWKRHQFTTPSGHVGTGPSYDHTLGKGKDGHYMYIEASSPRKENDTARLFSPVYSSYLTPSCFVFWYHMYGATTGSLRIFLKKESQVFRELLPVWIKEGEQGNVWLQSSIEIPELKEKFQVIIEGIRGTSYVGDTAIDDVYLYSVPCENLAFSNITKDSCQGRCEGATEETSVCSCTNDCVINGTCCDDYQYFCTDIANRTQVFGSEPPPNFKTTSDEIKNSSEITTTTNSSGVSSEITNFSLPIPTSIVKQTTSQPTVASTKEIGTLNTTSSMLTKSLNTTENATAILSTFPTQNSTVASTTGTNNLTATTAENMIPTTERKNETSTEASIIINQPTDTPTTTRRPYLQSTTVFTNKTSSLLTTTESLTTLKGGTTPNRNTTKFPYLSIPTTTATTPNFLTSSTSNVPAKQTTTWTFTSTKKTSRFTPNTSLQPTTIQTSVNNPTPTELYVTKQPTSKQQNSMPSTNFKTTTQNQTEILQKQTPVITTTPPTTAFATTPTTAKTKKTRKTTTTILPSTKSPPVRKTTRYVPTTKRNFSNFPIMNTTVFMTTTTPQAGKFIPTTAETTTFPTKKIQNKTHLPEVDGTSTTAFRRKTTTAPWTTNRKWWPFIKPNNKTTSALETTAQPTKAVTQSSTVSTKVTAAMKKTTSTKKSITKINTKEKLKPTVPVKRTTFQNLITSTSTKPDISETSTTEKSVITDRVTKFEQNIDYSSRTKRKHFSKEPLKGESSTNVPMIIGIIIGISTMLIAIAFAIIYRRKQKMFQNKLAEDSEMRFLSDNEIIEFSDPSISSNSTDPTE